MRVRLNIDGGVRTGGAKGPTGGSTGPASIGFVIRDESSAVLRSGGMEIGEATVNEAEYSALIAGLYNCKLAGAAHVEVFADSQVLVRQMNGEYRVRAENLKPYNDEAHLMTQPFASVTFTWVPREHNKDADKITEDYLGKR